MTNFIPIFPLGIVVFPTEQLNLHIFEPRYKQLIQDCVAAKKPFGIPTSLEKSNLEYGTLVTIKEISKVYTDGKMDIKTEAGAVFKILELVKKLPDKLYRGAIVNYPENELGLKPGLISTVLAGIRHLHQLLHIQKEFNKPEPELSSYDLAHHAGLNLQEEYEILQLMREDQRLEYLKRHLQKVLPIISEMEKLKERVKLNGHFRELSGFGLE